MNKHLTRRHFIGRSLSIGAVGVAGTFLAACGKKDEGPADPCSDETGLSDTEKMVRKSSSYSLNSAHAKKRCDNCTHWSVAKPEAPCGGCKVVKGPIKAAGYCNLWLKKA